jgi:hypothetical protein
MYDKLDDILWTCHFLEAQGYTISANIVFQENTSMLFLKKKTVVFLAPNKQTHQSKIFLHSTLLPNG